MRTRSILCALLAACLVTALVSSTGLAAGKGKKKSGPQVVGKDDPGDWGSNADATLQPIGDGLGQELVEASIGMADAKTIDFIIKVNGLPPTGGVPEISRYNWDINVDGNAYQLTGAFTEYLRGVCNPLHTNSCPPPQDPGMQPFFIRQGPCTVGAECHVLGIVQAVFDAGAGTITIPVPMELLEAKPGSKIAPGATAFGGTIYAAPAVVVTNASVPMDLMTLTGTFVVPSGKKR